MSRNDPRGVRVADVWKGERPAATLTRTATGTEFAYRADYLADPGPAVATTLPVRGEPVRTTGGALPPFFSGLLPEGRRLTNLRQAVKTSADDELSLLLAVGADPVGDVRVLPADTIPPDTDTDTDPHGAPSFDEVDFTDLLADSGVIDPIALPGVQDKVSGRMLTVPLQHRGRAHLLKLSPPEYPRVVENEAFFLGLARRLRAPVAQAQVVHDRNGRAGLLVTRFDRVPRPDGRLRRLAVEDATQLLGRYPADKYAVTSEEVATALADVCAARAAALRSVFLQVAMSWLTGNGDLHAKNLAVLSRGGERVVAPTYDIPSTLPYGDHTLALPVGGRRDGLSRRRLLTFAADIDLPQRAAERAIDAALSATADAADQVSAGAIGLDPRRRRDLTRGLRARRRTLQA